MRTEICVSEDDLKAFALGHLDEDRSEEIAAHLSECIRCEETIASFDDTADSMLVAVRQAAVKTETVQTSIDPVLRKIINPWSGFPENSAETATGEWIRDYELLEPLGHGAMGTVYKAVHARLQRPVAIKLLPSRRLQDPDAVARFEREMKAIGRLDHPAIVRATDAGEVSGTHFLAMDFVDGIDLSQLVRLNGPMDTASACEVIRQAALGLQYAHEQGLIHRDVKPSNLMIEVSPTCESKARVKLLDLGLALFGAASEAVDELTTVGQLMGTLDYMAPEQADNSHDVDARADVYSLGATLFKLLTGTAPYENAERRSPLQKMKALATVDVPSVKTRRPALPDDVASIVDRMLLRDPAGRIQTAAEVAHAVAPFCDGSSLTELALGAKQLRESSQKPGILKDAGLLPTAVAGLPTPAVVAGLPTEPRPATAGLPAATSSLAVGRPPGRLITRSVMATLGGLLLLAAAILIRVKTDTGTLTIECSSDSIPVQIRQAGGTVRELTLTAGSNEITLRSGQYEIKVPAEYDSVSIENGHVEISRGGVWLAKVSHQSNNSEATSETASSSDETNLLPQPSSSAPVISPPSIVQAAITSQPTFADPIDAVTYTHLAERYASLLRTADEARDLMNDQSRVLGKEHPTIRSLQESLMRIQSSLLETHNALSEMLMREAAIVKDKAGYAAEPVFNGKTFDQWVVVARTERSPAELATAMEAIRRFTLQATDEQRKEIAAVAVQLIIRMGKEGNDSAYRGGVRPAVKPDPERLGKECRETIAILAPELTLPELVDAIRQDPDENGLANLFDHRQLLDMQPDTELPSYAMLALDSPEFRSALVDRWPKAQGSLQGQMIWSIIRTAHIHPDDAGVRALLRTIAADPESDGRIGSWPANPRQLACRTLALLGDRDPELVAWTIDSLEAARKPLASDRQPTVSLWRTIDGFATLYVLRDELGPHSERFVKWLNSDTVLTEPVARLRFERRLPDAGFINPKEPAYIVSPTVLLLELLARMDASIRSKSTLDEAIRRIAEMPIPDSSRLSFDAWVLKEAWSCDNDRPELLAKLNTVSVDEPTSASVVNLHSEQQSPAAVYRSRFLARLILGLPDDSAVPAEPAAGMP